jgi:hypothetical protein
LNFKLPIQAINVIQQFGEIHSNCGTIGFKDRAYYAKLCIAYALAIHMDPDHGEELRATEIDQFSFGNYGFNEFIQGV